MKLRIIACLALATAVIGGAATGASAAPASSGVVTEHVTADVQASAAGNGFGTLYIQDDEAAGKMVGASYTARDGYRKIVLGLDEHVIAVDIANCGHAAN